MRPIDPERPVPCRPRTQTRLDPKSRIVTRDRCRAGPRRLGSRIASSIAVDVAAMGDPHDLYDQAPVDHLIDDPEVSDAHSVNGVLPDQSDASRWPRLGGQEVYRSSNPDLIVTRQPSDRPDRAPWRSQLGTASLKAQRGLDIIPRKRSHRRSARRRVHGGLRHRQRDRRAGRRNRCPGSLRPDGRAESP